MHRTQNIGALYIDNAIMTFSFYLFFFFFLSSAEQYADVLVVLFAVLPRTLF